MIVSKLLLRTDFILLIFIVIIFFNNKSVLSQQKEKIRVQKSFASTKFYYGTHKLNNAELEALLEKVPTSRIELKLAKQDRELSNAIGFIGLLFIGYNITQLGKGNESPDWYYAGFGGFLMTTSFIIRSTSQKHIENSVIEYNNFYDETKLSQD